jgi:hypothetical protein
VEILCTSEKNHSESAKPRKFTIQKKKLVTKQTYSHTPDAVIVPLNLTHIYTSTPLNQTSYLKGSSMDSFSLEFIFKIDFKRLIKSHKYSKRVNTSNNIFLNTLS